MAAAAAAQPATAATSPVGNGHTIWLKLYKDVSNAEELCKAVADAKVTEAAFLNATMVAGLFAVKLAAFKALEAQVASTLKAKTVHAQLIFGLAATSIVEEAFKRCGIQSDTQHVLVAKLDATPEDVQSIEALVQGIPVPLEQLAQIHQPELIQQAYKLSLQELQVGSLEDAVVAKMAAREA